MPIDYSGFAFPKGAPLAAVTEQRRAERKSHDEAENDVVKARSGGQCEIWWRARRCTKRANQVHHMEGGNGVRARGSSALAERKQHACQDCHALITSKRLVRIGSVTPHFMDRYRRVRAKEAA